MKNNDDDISIVSIFGKSLLSIKYGEEDNEYDKFFDMHNDTTYVRTFFKENESFLENEVWKNIPNIESATRQVIKEAEELEIFLEELALNSENNEIPDLDSHFKYLEGEFKNVYEYTPVKSYGPGRPSLLRLYAIKLAPNKYVITGGGIKLGDKIQTSPGIKDFVLKDIRRVRKYLIDNFS